MAPPARGGARLLPPLRLERDRRRDAGEGGLRLADQGGCQGDLLDRLADRDLDLPTRIVGAETAEVADVADVVAAPWLVHVFRLERPSEQLLEPPRSLEDRNAVRAAAAEVVDGRDARLLVEGQHRGADVIRVDVVADLLALVAEDSVRPALADRPGEIGEEPVELGARVVWTGQAAAAEAGGRQAEVAAVLLHEQVGRGLRDAEEAVHGRVDAAGLVDPVALSLVRVIPPGLQLDER